MDWYWILIISICWGTGWYVSLNFLTRWGYSFQIKLFSIGFFSTKATRNLQPKIAFFGKVREFSSSDWLIDWLDWLHELWIAQYFRRFWGGTYCSDPLCGAPFIDESSRFFITCPVGVSTMDLCTRNLFPSCAHWGYKLILLTGIMTFQYSDYVFRCAVSWFCKQLF